MTKTCETCKHRETKNHRPPCVNCGRKNKWAPAITRESITEAFPDAEFLFADGLDGAIIGLTDSPDRVIYSVKRCIEILAEGMTEEEAEEYFEYNTRGSYMGENTPIWCEDRF